MHLKYGGLFGREPSETGRRLNHVNVRDQIIGKAVCQSAEPRLVAVLVLVPRKACVQQCIGLGDCRVDGDEVVVHNRDDAASRDPVRYVCRCLLGRRGESSHFVAREVHAVVGMSGGGDLHNRLLQGIGTLLAKSDMQADRVQGRGISHESPTARDAVETVDYSASRQPSTQREQGQHDGNGGLPRDTMRGG